METQDFGSFLRRARERREIPLSEIARKTKVSSASLQLLEDGKLDELPAEVFVRGFIRSYARSLGIPDSEPMRMFEKAIIARRKAEEVLTTTPVPPMPPSQAQGGAGDLGDDGLPHRRGIGLAVFVIIVLLIATITLSLYLGQPPQSGEGLSDRSTDPTSRPGPSLFLG